MTRRIIAVVVLLAWAGGLVALVRREYFRPRFERLAEAALRVTPGAVFYGVMQGAQQIGFASSTIDTAETTITVSDYFVADLPLGGQARRASARTNVVLSRGLKLRTFDLALRTEGTPVQANGRVDGDSVLLVELKMGDEPATTQRFPIAGPILLPTLLPLAVALGERPSVGRHYSLPVFDPTTMASKEVGLDVRAESLFVLDDSAVFDVGSGRWKGVHPDTVRAWQIVSAGSNGGFTGWVDEQGHIMSTKQLGLAVERQPYEVAVENWRLLPTHDRPVTDARDIMETTAIAANLRMADDLSELRVRLKNVNLSGFDLRGDRQSLMGDTLVVKREAPAAIRAGYALPDGARGLDSNNLKAEPLLQSDDRTIQTVARRLSQGSTDPVFVARRLNDWVYTRIKPRVTFGVPNALSVLKSRTGDCNEHTQLYVALARSIGIPARVASGLAYVNGKFYYHAWPEILIGPGEWIAADPTFGQFPADAAHLRFIVGGLARQAELLRLIGNLDIDVLATRK